MLTEFAANHTALEAESEDLGASWLAGLEFASSVFDKISMLHNILWTGIQQDTHHQLLVSTYTFCAHTVVKSFPYLQKGPTLGF